MPRGSPPRRRKRRIPLDTLTILATALSATLVRAFAPPPPSPLRLNPYCKVLNFVTSLGNRPPEPHGRFACGMCAHTSLRWQQHYQDPWLGSGGSGAATFRLSVASAAVARVEERLGQGLLLHGNRAGGGCGIRHVHKALEIGRNRGCREGAKWVLLSATMTDDAVRTADTNEVCNACVGRGERGVDAVVAGSSLSCVPASAAVMSTKTSQFSTDCTTGALAVATVCCRWYGTVPY